MVQTKSKNARFEVSVVVKIQAEVFWIVIPCSVVIGYRHFKSLCCLHLQSKVTGNGKK